MNMVWKNKRLCIGQRKAIITPKTTADMEFLTLNTLQQKSLLLIIVPIDVKKLHKII